MSPTRSYGPSLTLFSWLAAAIFSFAMPLQAQDLGCPAEVSLNGAVIEVEASASGDDTENIQCALEAAAAGGYREVFLTSSEYGIGAIEVTGFVGDLRGRSATNTAVTVLDGSLSCAANTPGTALRFNVGTAAVRRMTINVDSPCGDGSVVNVIAYYTDPADCSKRTTNGNVDRVTIAGAGIDGSDVVTGVVMDAAPECDPVSQKILGTLKINRSVLSGLEFGVLTSIAGGGQVDINYNDMLEIGLPITIVDAFQSTTILGNEISFNDQGGYDAGSGLGTTAIYVASTADSPDENSTTIKNNTFLDGGATSEGYALLSGQTGKNITHGIVVTGNTFEGNDGNSSGAGMAVIDTSGGLVSGNNFKGFAGTWVALTSGAVDAGFLGSTVSGWALVSNSFQTSTATTDVALGAGTQGNVVGRDQGPPVVNDSGENDVLESTSSSSSFLPSTPIATGAQDLHQRQLETIRGRAPARGLAR